MSACEATVARTVTRTGTVSRKSDAPAFRFDVMPKITKPAEAATSATATATATALTRAASTIEIENKCPEAEATAFSYQRAAKRAAPQKQHCLAAEISGEIAPIETLDLVARSNNPCEDISGSSLALRKARLKADFFGGPSTSLSQQQQQQQQHQKYIKTQTWARTEPHKPVQQLIEQFQAMIVQQEQQQQQQREAAKEALPGATASDEGCNVTGGGLSPYSSDNEDLTGGGGGGGGGRGLSPRLRKSKVTRCASSDSALGLEVDDSSMDTMPVAPPQRRMTLTVTDLPLRPALLPLAEPTALPDSPLTSPTGSASVAVPTKVLLEERVVAAPGSRRESTQSSYSELGASGFPAGVRYVRTPSVVVSDYSDDITACGISMEEMEYFRLQRARVERRCSLEAGHGHAGFGMGSGGGGATPGCPKDEGQSDVSAASSCSNLYYCGSTISALDGGECIVNGIRVALARKGSTQSSSLSDEDEEEVDEELELDEQLEQERQREEEAYERGERERQLSELLAATQLGERQRDRSKKVGAPHGHSDVTNQGNLKIE
ncbi:uncharacterized protein Dana_GF19400 [Drosophila ananassae]|uniref:Uncharacterized protein n=1 Tax=Drosophila ananassae TaxID=7217 RepID=B3MXQ0_DROAN|nr:uncharacterized protein LOC123256976 [Drosophila ananassae]EDV38515.2 uncharacterized protein Dana_GF19400 [Drosophila ananassae]